MRKILMFLNDTTFAWNLRREILQAIVGSGYETVLVANILEFKDKLEALGCRIIKVDPGRRGTNPLSDLLLFREYLKILKKERPDAVLASNIKPDIYSGLACRLMHIPFIPTVTGLGTPLENPGLLHKITKFLYRIGLRKANVVFFQNAENRKLFEKWHIGKKYRIVSGSGVNLNKHCFEKYPAQDTLTRFLFVGRIMRDKGIFELLEAVKSVKQRHPAVQFDLIGRFDESLQSTVEEAVSLGYVNYLGFQTEMHMFYKECWAIVMPSYHEGMCNVCLEGAATGRPILASDVPGCRETFDDGISGIGFEVKSVKALTEAIEKFLSLTYEEKAAMGIAGRKKMEREFDREKVVQAYMDELNKALN